MTAYSLYFTDFRRPMLHLRFQCEGDEDAVRYVEQRREQRPAELRNENRLVARFEDERLARPRRPIRPYAQRSV